MSDMSSDPARAVANFHTLFNAVIALAFLPLLAPYAALLTRWLPKRTDPNDPARPQYLDEWAHDVPAVALGNAAREALRMADKMCIRDRCWYRVGAVGPWGLRSGNEGSMEGAY